MINISLLGASGSIGRQTLDVCRLHRQQLRIAALSVGRDWRFAAQAAREWQPQYVAIADETAYGELKAACAGLPLTIGAGPQALLEAAAYDGVDTTLVAISGVAALPPLLAAIAAGKNIALANKEALAAAGELIMPLVEQKGLKLAPVDSEHAAIWQCLAGERVEDVERLLLTASGGAFRELPLEQLAQVTPQLALQHPNWRMGPKITVDCATMVNKGLEIMEAHWLFGIEYARIEALLHPESIVHSLVAFKDGSVKAQLAAADMRLPIQYALLGQQRPASAAERLDLAQLGELHFSRPDPERYPALATLRQAAALGGSAPAFLNGANEALVRRFLAGELPFLSIAATLEKLLDSYTVQPLRGIEDVIAADNDGRVRAVES